LGQQEYTFFVDWNQVVYDHFSPSTLFEYVF
jgi:hypothetical protein